jgi:hypothetical protein
MNLSKIVKLSETSLKEIKKIWLNEFPIQELPDDYTQLVVRSFRNDNSLEITALEGLNRRKDMLIEWFNNQLEINKMMQDYKDDE